MIAVCGATGQIGGGVISICRQRGVDAVAVAEPGSRPPSGYDGTLWRPADYGDRRALEQAFAGTTAVLLVTPPDPRQVWWQRNIIDAAHSAGSSWVVKVSAFAARRDSPTNMGRWHYDGELALRDSGLQHAIVRPQYFMNNLLRSASSVQEQGLLRSQIPPHHPIAMIDVRDVASVCFELLAQPQLLDAPVVPTGPEPLFMAEVADRLGDALGKQVRYEFVEHDRSRAEMAASGTPSWRQQDSLAITSDCGPEVTGDVETLTGQPARTIDDFARAHVREFRG